MAKGPKARVQGEGQRNGRTPDDIPNGFVSWEEHHLAWEEYQRHVRGQSSEEVESHGGFGYREIAKLLGRNPTTWEPAEMMRYQSFVFHESERPGDVLAPEPEPEAPASHIRYGGNEQPICKDDAIVPDGVLFFDASEGAYCPDCMKKITTFIIWWKTYDPKAVV